MTRHSVIRRKMVLRGIEWNVRIEANRVVLLVVSALASGHGNRGAALRKGQRKKLRDVRHVKARKCAMDSECIRAFFGTKNA